MTTLNLGGQWKLNRLDQSKSIPATVPGDVYNDLFEAGEIPDPFYRDNENDLQWIGESDWRYCHNFELSEDILAQEQIMLACDGLDTFATVTINGQQLTSTNNMFRAWQWDIKDIAKASNTIEIMFKSTIPYIEQKQSERALPYWGMENAACFSWVRKEQCNYGWDWGIKAVTCGIWRDINIIAFSTSKLENVMITQDHLDDGSVDVNIDITTTASVKPLKTKITAELKGEVIATAAGEISKDGSGKAKFNISNPQLWWPNNMGSQPLYEIKVELFDNNELLDCTTRRIGLRTLILDRHDDQWGESFQFVVNGQPFFAKGANWIPADGIQARVNAETYKTLLGDAAAVNMNMIRVWGGGIYEEDAFYDTCDELGLCVWQDFMFACATYPTYDKDFMDNVEAEAKYNIKRLHHRACLALWCGNNELEQGLVSDKWSDDTMSWQDYTKLFDELLSSLVKELSPNCDYWPGSPHTSKGDRKDFNNPNSGDAHLWDVWHQKKPFEWYRTCEHRFNSEFGFQSFPEPQTVYSYTAAEDRNITSWVMEHHQRSGIGNTTIMQYMLDWFKMPLGFENTLWASQILQAMAMKYACEHWRRSMPRGMGTLYWQLNDTWPVASWSSIDYYGRWKALNYMARKFYAPLLISGLEDTKNNTVEVHVTSDMLKDTAGIARWIVTDLEGKTLLEDCKEVNISSCNNSLVETLDLSEIIKDKTARNIIVWLELESDNKIISDNMVLFARPKHLQFTDENKIDVRVERNEDMSFNVTLKADKPALWCRVEISEMNVKYSDNFINLRPGKIQTVNIVAENNISIEEFKNNLKVQTLTDTY